MFIFSSAYGYRRQKRCDTASVKECHFNRTVIITIGAWLFDGWMDFAKTGEIKGDMYLHGVRYDNKKFLCFIVIRYLLLKYFVL